MDRGDVSDFPAWTSGCAADPRSGREEGLVCSLRQEVYALAQGVAGFRRALAALSNRRELVHVARFWPSRRKDHKQDQSAANKAQRHQDRHQTAENRSAAQTADS